MRKGIIKYMRILRPFIIDLGKKLVLHMENEDNLFMEITKCSITDEEATFLETCIRKQH
jgi:hypothetical protein